MPSHLHHVIHFNIGYGRDPQAACNRSLVMAAPDYSFQPVGVTCGRCRRTTAFNLANNQALDAEIDRMPMTYAGGSPSIPTVDWQEVGGDLDVDPQAWLKAHIVICGVDMHLEAIWVVDEEGLQVGICPNLDEILQAYAEGASPDGHWQTMERNGLTYALFATPYC